MKGRLEREEIVAMVGGLLLALGLFLTWYTLKGNIAHIGSYKGASVDGVSAWKALKIMRIFLLLGAIAPFVLAYIIVRGHALSWPRGELTAVVALTAVTLVLLRGLVIKPGEPSGEIGLGIGWFVSLAGSAIMLYGSVTHASRGGTRIRKPPGVL